MIFHSHRTRSAQRGVVLVSSLLLLIVVTIIALSMFRSFGIQEKIAGNMREKQRALQAAESAQVYAEWWLSGNGSQLPQNCTTMMNANIGQGQICANQITDPLLAIDVTTPPYRIAGAPVGVTYLPNLNMQLSTTTSFTTGNVANPTYFDRPAFYISDVGKSADATYPGEVYQVDAYGYGGSGNTVAVVESTYVVSTDSSCLGGSNC
jgi:type IV pilus assembly protein PilX